MLCVTLMSSMLCDQICTINFGLFFLETYLIFYCRSNIIKATIPWSFCELCDNTLWCTLVDPGLQEIGGGGSGGGGGGGGGGVCVCVCVCVCE